MGKSERVLYLFRINYPLPVPPKWGKALGIDIHLGLTTLGDRYFQKTAMSDVSRLRNDIKKSEYFSKGFVKFG
jgi:hypothetical protein